MALSVSATNDCNHLSITTSYNSAAVIDINFYDANGASINATGTQYTITIPTGGNTVSTPVPVSDLTISAGVIKIIASISGSQIDEAYILLHCDIDCCLAKLTNELIDCACDCERCSKALAQAQKVFLLIQSANFALVQAEKAPAGNESGYILDASNKYSKALEICNETCGCNC